MDKYNKIDNTSRREKKDVQVEADINSSLWPLPKKVVNQTILHKNSYNLGSNVLLEFEDDKVCQENIINEKIISLKDENNELKNEIRKLNSKIELKENHLNELKIQIKEHNIEIKNLKNDNERQKEELRRLIEIIKEKKTENDQHKIENDSNNLLRRELEKEVINLRNENESKKKTFDLMKIEKEKKEKEITEMKMNFDKKEKQLLKDLKEKEEEIINLRMENTKQHKELNELRIKREIQENEIKELSNKFEKHKGELNLLSECKEKENAEKVNFLQKIKTPKKEVKSAKKIKRIQKEEQQKKRLSDLITLPIPNTFEILDRLKAEDLIANYSWEIFDVFSIRRTEIIIISDHFNSNDKKYRFFLTLKSNGCSAHHNKHFCVEVSIGNNPKGSGAVWPLECIIIVSLKNKSNVRSLEVLTDLKILRKPNTHDSIIFHFTKVDINETHLFPENSILFEFDLLKINNSSN